MARCTKCDAPVRWARTTARKNIPLDVEPVEGGNVRDTGERDGPFLVVEVVAAGQGTMVSHFATCPYADEFRGKSRDDGQGTLEGLG